MKTVELFCGTKSLLFQLLSGLIVYKLIISIIILHYLATIVTITQTVFITMFILSLLFIFEPFLYFWYIKSELRSKSI
jgi:hypothetical protein